MRRKAASRGTDFMVEEQPMLVEHQQVQGRVDAFVDAVLLVGPELPIGPGHVGAGSCCLAGDLFEPADDPAKSVPLILRGARFGPQRCRNIFPVFRAEGNAVDDAAAIAATDIGAESGWNADLVSFQRGLIIFETDLVRAPDTKQAQ